MAKTAICIADGVEEIEALTVVDLMRRAKLDIDMISVQNRGRAMGSHCIQFECDYCLKDIDLNSYDAIVLPGGLKGTENLMNNVKIIDTIQTFFEKGKLVAAICAAPTVLGEAGILRDKKATCYPGMENGLLSAKVSYDPVVIDGNIITSRGMGTVNDFALEIIRYLADENTAKEIADRVVYSHFEPSES